ncbi:MAG: DUF262 domain-containing protein [Nitrosopumilaceae archaeon]
MGLSIFETGELTVAEIYEQCKSGKLRINESYQRSEVWKPSQKQALIESILEQYPIGVLVLWENKDHSKEILDGQQRVKTIEHFIDEEEGVTTQAGTKFSQLGAKKSKFEAYSIPYLEINHKLTEDEISNIFIRLQEGIPLNTPEKVYAFRGNFRESWFNAFQDNKGIFFVKLNPKKFRRFKDRFLSAQFLLLEMKSRFKKKDFPSLTYPDFQAINDDYKTKKIPNSILERLNANIKFLGTYLHNRLKTLEIRDLISIYLLQSYFKQFKVMKKGDAIIFRDFVMDFMHDLNKVNIYSEKVPRGMNKKLYRDLRKYKEYGRQATSSESLEVRFKTILNEYKKKVGKITEKDKKRFYSSEERINFWHKQKGLCPACNEEIDFSSASADHKIEHSAGGKTVINNGRLLHKKCHEKHHKTKT